MAEGNVTETTRTLVSSLSETNKKIADTAIASQERNLAFAQSILENAIEMLKSQAESTRTLTQELVERAKTHTQAEDLQAFADHVIATQERNIKFAQSVVENAIEVLKSQVGIARSLIQELGQQAQRQQETFQSLAQESFDAYLTFLRTPLSYYQQAFEAAETATRRGLESFQEASRQAVESMRRATHSVQ